MGEGVGRGVCVGRRAILVFLKFFGVWQGKEVREGVFVFRYFFLEGGPVAGQVFVLVCV
jgi:hypothetical protein